MRHIDLKLHEIPIDRPLRVEDGRTGIVVIRTLTSVAAYEDVCPHAQWRLSDGEIVDGALECPGHAWEFCPKTGRCVNVPVYSLKPISLERRGDRIRLMVEMQPSVQPQPSVEAVGAVNGPAIV